MANVRPKRTNNVRVDSFEEPAAAPPVQEETPRSYFASDFTNMHQKSFAENSQAASFGINASIKGVRGCTIETLVSTLASLQYTTKGRIGEDGKFELIFCSPEPVVSEAPPPTPEPVTIQKQVRYVEEEPRRHHRHKVSSRSKALKALAYASPY